MVETLPPMQHGPHRPDHVLKVDCDEDGVGGDDAADCLRYLVATRARTVTQRKLRGFNDENVRPLGFLFRLGPEISSTCQKECPNALRNDYYQSERSPLGKW